MTAGEAGVKACLAVRLALRTHAGETCSHLGDCRDSTGDVDLLGKTSRFLANCGVTRRDTYGVSPSPLAPASE